MAGVVLSGSVARCRWRRTAALGLAVVLGTLGAMFLDPPPASALDPVNPVRVTLNGHPANSGFLVFVEDDVRLDNDESEGTIAAGGDLTLGSNYQIAGNAGAGSTFTAPGDSGPTFLYVGGGVFWDSPAPIQVYVQNQGFTKILDTSTYDAFNRDNNNALVNYRIVPPGQPYTSPTFIDGRTNQQTPASIGTPVPQDLIDIPAAFDLYRELTQEMAACAATVQLTDTGGTPLPRPIAPGTPGRITLTPGQTNVLTLSATELDNLSEITFLTPPTASTPLLVNVTGPAFSGDVPNLAGIGGSQAPYMLWNFPDADSILVTGGASLEGTIYAPNADVVWAPTQNIEGNVIAADFTHGRSAQPTGGAPREIHDFPFATTLSCEADAPPAAELTLVKTVTNDDGGSALPTDWTLSATGPTPITGTSGEAAVTDATVTPGDYVLAEADGPAGYDAGEWSCTGGTLAGSTLTLADGDDVTCTLDNDDRPDEPTPTPTPSPSPTPTISPSPSPVVPSSTTPGTSPSTVSPTSYVSGATGDLPGTGGPSVWWLLGGLACVAAGLVLVRRREVGHDGPRDDDTGTPTHRGTPGTGL